MPSPEVFFSYAHTDEPLLLQLRKHLAALERAQLIQGWFDRKIEPGSEWAPEIQAAMERAAIILLLISADFVASEYCTTVELPFALERHKAGVLVIPILLRPVAWEDLPVSALQALPTGAKPVTTWPNSDEAFRDIAEHLREMILTRRLKSMPKSPVPVDSVSADRVLDAAVPSSVEWNEPSQLVAMIRRVGSAGLKAILQVSTTFAAKPEDVRESTIFEVEFPVDAAGKTLPAALELVLESPGCEPPANTKKVRVPPAGDSEICVFLFTPKKMGQLMFNLGVRYEAVEVGSQFLVSEAIAAVQGAYSPAPYSLASLPLSSTTFFYGMRAMAAAAGAPIAAPPSPAPPIPFRPPHLPYAPIAPPTNEPPGPLPPFPPPSVEAFIGQYESSSQPYGHRPVSQNATPPPAAARPRSRLSNRLMTFASAAAVFVLAGLTFITYKSADNVTQRRSAASPPPESVAHPAPPPPVHVSPTQPVESTPPVESAPQRAETASVPALPPPAPEAVKAVPALKAAQAAFASKDYESAADNLTVAISEQPDNAELYWRRAEVYRALGKPELAMLDADQALELAPNDPYAHLVKGELLSDEALQARASEVPDLRELALSHYQKAKAAPNLTATDKEFVERRIRLAAKASAAPRPIVAR